MTVGDKDCCSRPHCGHGEAYHDLRRDERVGPCALCTGKSRKYGCRVFAAPLAIGANLVLLGQKFWYDFERNKDFPKDPAGWVECSFADVEWGSVVVKPKGHEKFVLTRRGIAERGALAKPLPRQPTPGFARKA